jgi:hypothetical protein
MAQDHSPPKVGDRPLVEVKPRAPVGCKLVGTVKGTKLWAGECVALELSSSQTAAEVEKPLAERAAGAIPPSRQ